MELNERESKLLQNYDKLLPEYQRKADIYLRDILKIQRAESRVTAQIHHLELKTKQERSKKTEGYFCSFCGKHQDEVNRLFLAREDLCICNECVELCSEIMQQDDET